MLTRPFSAVIFAAMLAVAPTAGFAQEPPTARSESSSTVGTDAGRFTVTRTADGKIRITAQFTGQAAETREFDSVAQFKTQWPEVAKHFGTLEVTENGVRLSTRSTAGNGNDLGNADADADLQKQLDALRERLRDLQRHRQNQGHAPLPDAGNSSGNRVRATIGTDAGRFTVEKTAEGKIRITAQFAGQAPQTREFDSVAQFKAEWPEVAGQFDTLEVTANGVRLSSRSSNGSDSPNAGNPPAPPAPPVAGTEERPTQPQSFIFANEAGSYTVKRLADGELEVRATFTDGHSVTRLFDSADEFISEWPEIAEFFAENLLESSEK